MSAPQRIQLRRVKGWRMPENTVKVCRPGPFGNPWIAGDPKGAVMMDGQRVALPMALTIAGCVARYRAWVNGEFGADAGAHQHHAFGFVMVPPGRARLIELLPTLRGRNLACFCREGQPCHVDVLLEVANRGA